MESENTIMAMSRPQVGIDRLQARKPATMEQKEAMNCKSCRKRKVRDGREATRSRAKWSQIKCNRLKPSCEACQVFNCACVYGEQSKLIASI